MPSLPKSFTISITVLCLYNYLRVTIARSPPSSKYPLEQQSTSLERYFSMSPEREIRTLKLQTANAIDEVVMLGGLVGLATQLSDIGTKMKRVLKITFQTSSFRPKLGKANFEVFRKHFLQSKMLLGKKKF